MKIYSEYLTTEKALFKRVNVILKQNGLYSITEHRGIFFLDYIFSQDWRFAYTVLKGRDGKAFKFTIGSTRSLQHEIDLVKGDVLYFCYQRTKKTFFYCPKALIGKREFDVEACIGFSAYGKKSAMLDEGLIKSCLSCGISTYFKQLQNLRYGTNYVPK